MALHAHANNLLCAHLAGGSCHAGSDRCRRGGSGGSGASRTEYLDGDSRPVTGPARRHHAGPSRLVVTSRCVPIDGSAQDLLMSAEIVCRNLGTF